MLLLVGASAARAQTIGPLTWHVYPYCNTLVLSVTPVGGTYRLDGYDNQCSAARRAAVTGEAVLNPNGTVGFALTIVQPGGQPVHVDTAISLATLSGPWTDNQGNSGTFTPGPIDGPPVLPLGTVLLSKSVAAPTFITRRGNGVTPGDPIATNTILLSFEAEGFDGNNYNLGALIRASATRPWAPFARGTRLSFATAANGSGNLGTRMVIDHDGQVGIGTTDPQQLLDVTGNVRVGATGGVSGCVEDRDGTLLTGNCASDARFKRDIMSFEPMLGKLAALRPVHYFWRADEFPARAFGQRQSYGLVAQEVEDVLPDLVSTDAEGYKAVNYSKLPLLAIQAIKELKAENDTLKTQLTEVLQRLSAIEARVPGR